MEEIIYNRCDGVILKLTKIDENKYIDKYGIVIDLDKSAILGKTSPNIIDLIEVGDIICIKDSLYDNEYRAEVFADYDNVLCINNFEETEIIELMKNIENEQIKLLSILTKEQYKANCYEV